MSLHLSNSPTKIPSHELINHFIPSVLITKIPHDI